MGSIPSTNEVCIIKFILYTDKGDQTSPIMNEQQIRAIVKDEMNKNYTSGAPKVPPHRHNGNDGLKLTQSNLLEFTRLDATSATNSVTSLAQSQAIEPANTINGNLNSTVIFGTPPNQIFNGGTALPGVQLYFINNTFAQLLALTTTISSGATSATLTSAWTGSSGLYRAQLGGQGGGQIVYIVLTNASASVAWDNAAIGNLPGGVYVLQTFQLWVRGIDNFWHGIDLPLVQS